MGNLVTRILNWRTTEEKLEFKKLMDGMFRDDKNPIWEVVPTPDELEALNLPPVAHDIPDVKYGVDGVHGTDLVDTDYDDFSTTTPHLSSGKQQQRNANSDSPRCKKRTQIPVSVSPSRKQPSWKEYQIKGTRKPDTPTGPETNEFKLIREEIQIFKKEVFEYMDNNFKKLLDALKGNQTPDKVAVSKAPSHQHDVGIQHSHEKSQRHRFDKGTRTVNDVVDDNMVGDTMLQDDLHTDGGISRGNQSGGKERFQPKRIKVVVQLPQRSHPKVVEAVGLPINDPLLLMWIKKRELKQSGDMENANAEFTASEEMIAELLVNCPLASVIPLSAPPVPRDDQADLSSLRTP
ncbi:uncharacterized protein LOC132063072 [Lycium ferocissimum]|uniref:uncharacterized protein LOC132063072 n=1 Tax=Lycium ferocissimum TaxID=112874 RepID=UPI0028160F6B|nr:uncharacterized protein LOC132063072 [Lycium ferocissimum]